MPFVDFKPPESNKEYKQPCVHPEHNPPGMIVLPPGEHTYQCPGCGEKVTFTVPQRPMCGAVSQSWVTGSFTHYWL